MTTDHTVRLELRIRKQAQHIFNDGIFLVLCVRGNNVFDWLVFSSEERKAEITTGLNKCSL